MEKLREERSQSMAVRVESRMFKCFKWQQKSQSTTSLLGEEQKEDGDYYYLSTSRGSAGLSKSADRFNGHKEKATDLR